MSTLEIKKRLIDEISSLGKKELLEELYRFLKLENKIKETFELSSEQKNNSSRSSETN